MTFEGKETCVVLCFFHKVQAELKKLFTHAPGWEASASATLTYVAPLVEAILVLVDPGAAPGLISLIQKIQSAVAAAAVVVKDAGPLPTLATYLRAINGDLAQLEAAAQIKDPATAAKVTATVASITAEIEAILAEVTPQAA